MILRLITLCLCLLLTACATMPAKEGARNENLSWPQRQKQLNSITAWHLTGALAYHNAASGQSASVVWQQTARDYQINLFGPLGLGRVSLIGTLGQSVTLTRSGKQYTAHSPEALMQQQLGWHLPVTNLFYWIRGLPAPHLAKTIQFDDYHHISLLQQQGWTITYQRYTAIANLDLPSKLTLENNRLGAKIVISQWQFPDAHKID